MTITVLHSHNILSWYAFDYLIKWSELVTSHENPIINLNFYFIIKHRWAFERESYR